MPKYYFYKMTSDNGGAPCVNGGLLSLAICKPVIRKTAKEEDFVFGFAADRLDRRNRLIYIAKITEVKGKEYYTDAQYRGRGDRIYRWTNGHFEWCRRALYHGPDDLSHDLGVAPEYPKARVLLSRDFRYLGMHGDESYKSRFKIISRAIESLGRGHRSRLGDDLADELKALKQEIWNSHSMSEKNPPTSKPTRRACQRSKSYGCV